MADDKKTAILIIHGVGHYPRFQAIQYFASGFLEAYKSKDPNVKKQHQLKKRAKRVQHCFTLHSAKNNETIDIYEYFWDVHMVHKVLLNEGWDLLVKASKNAKKYYDENKLTPEAVAKLTDMEKLSLDKSPYFRKKKFKNAGKYEFVRNGYLRLVGGATVWIIKIVPYIKPVISGLEYLSELNIPVFSPAYKAVSTGVKWLLKTFQNKIEEYFLGDVVRYLDMDPRSMYYQTRQTIINGAVDELCSLIEPDEEYEQVIVAGHSLGSVIAYDTLNRIVLQSSAGMISNVNTEKIKGLITFGSPLDKIAFFFREYVDDTKQIQRKMIEDTHSFRAVSLLDTDPGIQNPNPFYVLPNLIWLNFYHLNDLVSGKLDLYDLSAVPGQKAGTVDKEGNLNGNIRIEKDVKKSKAHGCYWGAKHDSGTGEMQETIIKEFFS
ncbi:MAG: hypothetical protein JSU79_01965 [Dehalococcoidales bacterium]|nr:MAG: hypothetical protein JSU79_01965 [Dehalococcoidales bacterium]